MIKSLQSFRGIFALAIFFHHYCFYDEYNFVAGGDMGVCFFFILSGFVMTLGYKGQVLNERFSFRAYFLIRLARYYPLHLLCMLYYLLLIFRTITPQVLADLLPNLFLLQSWSLDEKIYFSGNAVSWFLSDMIFFYAIFPLIIRIFHWHPRLFVGVFATALIAYFGFVRFLPPDIMSPMIYIFPLTRLLDFSIGIVLCEIYFAVMVRFSKLHKSCLINSIVETVSIAIVAFSCIIYNEIPDIYRMTSMWWIPMMLLVLVFSLTSDSNSGNCGFWSRIFSWRPFIFFGDISFSFYMIHLFVFWTLEVIFRKLTISFSPPITLIVVLAINTVAAALISRYFERPVVTSLKKMIM